MKLITKDQARDLGFQCIDDDDELHLIVDDDETETRRSLVIIIQFNIDNMLCSMDLEDDSGHYLFEVCEGLPTIKQVHDLYKGITGGKELKAHQVTDTRGFDSKRKKGQWKNN